MSEILNYYKKRKIETHLLTDKYFDIVLARDEGETSNVKYDAASLIVSRSELSFDICFTS